MEKSCLASFILLSASGIAFAQKPNLPNIILIVTDQHRGDALGCMGNTEVITPTLTDWQKTAAYS